ncbi:MAG: nuclear transport factor 2 family protein [Actinomycetota bacterium]
MTTRDTIEGYFECLSKGNGWQAFLSEEMLFTSHTSPIKQVAGKAAYLESTMRFYSTIASCEVRELMVNEDRACALTRYELMSPSGGTFHSDVAELFTVKNDKIDSFDIYFDTAPFPA